MTSIRTVMKITCVGARFLNKKYHTQYNAEEKLWYGNKFPTIYTPKASLGYTVLEALKRNPDKVIQVSDDTGSQLTAGECRLKTIRAAQNLQRLGYKTNEVFGFMTNNHHSLAPIVYAALCLGCPINALAANYEESEIVHMFGITKPVVIFCEDKCYETLKRSLDKLGSQGKIFMLDGNRENTANVDELFAETGSETDFIPINVDAENHIAAILCSSGSTGLPKGVSVTHASLTPSAISVDLSDDNVSFTFTSLFWISGLFMYVSGPILGFKRIITTKSFSPEYLLNLIEKYKITTLFAANFQVILTSKCASIENTDLSSVKTYIVAGGAVSSSVIAQMNKFLPNGQILINYGLSEVGLVATNKTKSTNSDDHCGSVKNGLEIKIIDETGKRLGVNEDGELCIKTSFKLLGYYKNPTATHELFDEEGFLLTGDVGHFDKNGYLHLVDRKKDIFKYYAMQISPSEIENVLMSFPAISSACVVGIPHELTRHLTAAVVVRRQGYDISKEQIHEFLSTRLPKTKQLFGGIYFVDSLPLTPSGKIIRREVLKIATGLFNEQRKNDQ